LFFTKSHGVRSGILLLKLINSMSQSPHFVRQEICKCICKWHKWHCFCALIYTKLWKRWIGISHGFYVTFMKWENVQYADSTFLKAHQKLQFLVLVFSEFQKMYIYDSGFITLKFRYIEKKNQSFSDWARTTALNLSAIWESCDFFYTLSMKMIYRSRVFCWI
jgi:hypothetical protein